MFNLFGRGAFSDFDNDPFFEPHRESFHNVFWRRPATAQIEHYHEPPRSSWEVARPHRYSLYENPFAQMNRMIDNAFRGFRSDPFHTLHRSFSDVGEDGQSYSYSSVSRYDNTGYDGQPKFFEATSSTRHGPGGVKETRKTIQDSETGINKMAIGHHINDRGHVIERTHNQRTNEKDERQNFINMQESDAARFNDEWMNATRGFKGFSQQALDLQKGNSITGSEQQPKSAPMPEIPKPASFERQQSTSANEWPNKNT